MTIVERVDDADASVLAWEGGNAGVTVYHRWIAPHPDRECAWSPRSAARWAPRRVRVLHRLDDPAFDAGYGSTACVIPSSSRRGRRAAALAVARAEAAVDGFRCRVANFARGSRLQLSRSPTYRLRAASGTPPTDFRVSRHRSFFLPHSPRPRLVARRDHRRAAPRRMGRRAPRARSRARKVPSATDSPVGLQRRPHV